ncbi:hypothetical protein M1N08_01545 [Dehalococcoidia bacterium]|nr:hypothetical protein [Dehalococcoidia bacterium]
MANVFVHHLLGQRPHHFRHLLGLFRDIGQIQIAHLGQRCEHGIRSDV